MIEALQNFWRSTGFFNMGADPTTIIKYLIMYVIIGALFYLAIWRKFEPMLLLPIAFGMLLANLPGAELYHPDFFLDKTVNFGQVLKEGGLLDILYIGVL